jgi:hypothetical protein
VTTPGVPVSPGLPPLENAAQAALRAAQDRLAGFTGRPAFPPVPAKEREEALKDAAQTSCRFCGAWHEGASSPACPRIAKCKMNGDGMITEVEFWPDGIVTSAIETDGDGKVRAVTHHRTDNWDTSRVVRVQDAAEEDTEDETDGVH